MKYYLKQECQSKAADNLHCCVGCLLRKRAYNLYKTVGLYTETEFIFNSECF